MYISFCIIFFKIIFNDGKKIVIVSLYQPFITYKFFFKLIKLSRLKLIIIVHDLIPLASNYPKLILSSQKSLLSLADEYIVHNSHSQEGLKSFNKKINLVRFPLMEIDNINYSNSNKKNKINFLFLGHLRKEKGIEILINVWKKFSKKYDNIELTIAGSIAPGLEYDFSGLKKFNSIFEYINDDKYFELIKTCDYGILPYTGGTNSGVFSTIVALNKPVITSDISLFKDSDFSVKELMFKSGDENNFLEILERLMINPRKTNKYFKEQIEKKIKKIRNFFAEELNNVFVNIND